MIRLNDSLRAGLYWWLAGLHIYPQHLYLRNALQRYCSHCLFRPCPHLNPFFSFLQSLPAMLNLRFFTTAFAALTFFNGVEAGIARSNPGSGTQQFTKTTLTSTVVICDTPTASDSRSLISASTSLFHTSGTSLNFSPSSSESFGQFSNSTASSSTLSASKTNFATFPLSTVSHEIISSATILKVETLHLLLGETNGHQSPVTTSSRIPLTTVQTEEIVTSSIYTIISGIR